MAYTSANYPSFDTPAAIAGKKFILYVANVPEGVGDPKWEMIGGLRDTGIQISADAIDASNKGSDGWGESIPGVRSWTASPTLVVKTGNKGDELIEAWVFDEDIQNERPALRFAFVNTQTKEYYDSWGTVSSYSIDASYTDVMTKSIEINGVCALTKLTNFDPATVVTD